MRQAFVACLVAVLLGLASSAASGGASPGTDARIDSLIADGIPSRAHWGVSVWSLSKGSRVYGLNEDRLFVPGSNMKLFTFAAALLRLGPDFAYTTGLYSNGPVYDGALLGDLFIRGSGDPGFASGFHSGSGSSIFEEWAGKLRAAGVTSVHGAIVGDGTAFDDEGPGEGWSWDDHGRCYAPEISALSFQDNSVVLIVSPGARIGDRSTVRPVPETSYVTIVNRTVTGRATVLGVSRIPGTNTVVVSGEIAVESAPSRLCSTIHDPPLYAATVFKEVLERTGIRVDGPAAIVANPSSPRYQSMTLVASHTSPPLAKMLVRAGQWSHNLSAELLLRTVGRQRFGQGSAGAGVRAVKEIARAAGMEEDGFSMRDGSGLSRLNLVSPRQLTRLLEYMRHQSAFPSFFACLPAAGGEGTLRNRVVHFAGDGRLRAKTGTLKHVVALSGYLRGRKGSDFVFSIMANNYLGQASEAAAIEDRICSILDADAAGGGGP